MARKAKRDAMQQAMSERRRKRDIRKSSEKRILSGTTIRGAEGKVKRWRDWRTEAKATTYGPGERPTDASIAAR